VRHEIALLALEELPKVETNDEEGRESEAEADGFQHADL